jgi:predicted transcriptional regulator
MTEILELETRRKIYDLILKNPGLHVNKIAEVLELSSQLVEYHLLFMQRHELVIIELDEGYKRCYVKGEIGLEDKKLLKFLRQDIPLTIILYLLKNPYSRHRDIYRELEISSPLSSYHLRKLVNNGILKISLLDNKHCYSVIDDKKIIRLLIRYRPTAMAEKVKDTWMDFTPG